MTLFKLSRTVAAASLVAAILAPVPALSEKVTIGQTFLASGLDPAQGSNGWALVSHGIAEQLFRVSRAGVVVPNLAASAARNGQGTWTVELAPDRFFSDGTPVTAAAVASALNRTGEKNPSARATAGRLTFAAVDADTLTVETEQSTTILPSILAEWAFPVYRLDGDTPIFTGPYAVENFEPGGSIEMSPNAHYADAEARPDVTLRRIADGQSLALAFASGELDMAFNLPVETLAMLEAAGKKVTTFPVAYQYMMWMNTRSPVLSDPKVRRAIDLTVNRQDLVTAEGPLPNDEKRASELLDAAGWLLGDDGIRSRDGARLEVVLYAYPQRPDLVTFQPVIRAALAKVGIAVTTQVSESPNDVAASGKFDLFLWAQHTAPAGDPGLFLSLFFETGAARNYSGWSNPEYDELIALLRAEGNPQARIDLARQAQEMIAAEAPVSFLVTPEWHVGLSAKLEGYSLWGSDYYVIRSDMVATQ